MTLTCATGGCDPTDAYSGSPFLLGDTVLVAEQSGPRPTRRAT
ncbi:hypothetical protein ACFZBU_38420 [Embleya sp. NPDC008237]